MVKKMYTKTFTEAIYRWLYLIRYLFFLLFSKFAKISVNAFLIKIQII